MGVITEANKTAEMEGHIIYAISRVAFFCVNSSKYEDMLEQSQGNSEQDPTLLHPCAGLVKLLSTGSFFFSHTLDLSKDLRTRMTDKGSEHILDAANQSYIWNKTILAGLIRIKNQELNSAMKMDVHDSGLLVSIMQGFVGCETVIISLIKWKIGIISRYRIILKRKVIFQQSWYAIQCKVHQQINFRGIDDDGNVSNFVETEFLMYNGNSAMSFLQIRGSIPLYWEQLGIQLSHKVKLSRGPEASIHATRKHFKELSGIYTKILIVNLLSQTVTSPEYPLSESYRIALLALPEFTKSVKYYNFDFHAAVQRDKYERVLVSFNFKA